jgi:hypothetical protein
MLLSDSCSARCRSKSQTKLKHCLGSIHDTSVALRSSGLSESQGIVLRLTGLFAKQEDAIDDVIQQAYLQAFPTCTSSKDVHSSRPG